MKHFSEKDIEWIKNNWEKIPDNCKTNLIPDRYKGTIKDLPMDEHIVVLLLDRQKPSVVRSYDFDEERLAITRTGKIIWGFDSGCSCPTPWSDSYPNCYEFKKSWKQMKITDISFDKDWEIEVLNSLNSIKKAIKERSKQ